jgi:hypothetical protein
MNIDVDIFEGKSIYIRYWIALTLGYPNVGLNVYFVPIPKFE